MGLEKGRDLGMPVDTFVDQAYEGLCAGKDQIVIGSIAGTPQEELGEVIDRRRTAAEKLYKALTGGK